MRLLFSLMVVVSVLPACNNSKIPDVDNITIQLSTRRFERDLFMADTNQLQPAIARLAGQYPVFTQTFLGTILNVDTAWRADSMSRYVKNFITSYRNVYDSSEKVFADFKPFEAEIKKGLQYVSYYFPSYKIPVNIITYIGPLDGFGDILDEGVFYIGLHQHLGNNFSSYRTVWVQETYPDYITQRFGPDYIAVNSIKNIVLDMYPEKSEDKSLLIQMVEKGRRLYLLNKFLPRTAEYKLIGYSEKQLKECYDHESNIWNLFVQNNFLQTIDYNVIKNYVGEGPKTPELGDASPGNIGSFAGWQIVKKFMDKNPKTDLKSLMQMDPEQLFQQAKYKP